MGLPTASLLAQAGHTVLGVDVLPHVVEAVNAGQTHFEETGLKELLHAAHASGRLKAFLTPQPADVFIISVPTPVDHATHAADMSYVQAAARNVAPVLKAGDLVVLESTSPMGATERDVRAIIAKANPAVVDKVLFAFCPERAIPGNTLHEMVHNDRYVGGLTAEATEAALTLYKTFVKGELIATTAATAEMVKLVENASRDVQIAFANELHLVCDKLGLDVREVVRLANRHPRVNILQPGPGVGGHCIPVDPWFIVDAAPEVTPLMRTARAVNDGKPQWVVDKVKAALKANPAYSSGATVAVMGLAYKPDVDDLRESPAMTIYELLRAQTQATIIACEPHVTRAIHAGQHGEGEVIPNLPVAEALQRADIVVFATAHTQFKTLNVTGKVVVDPVGILG